MTPTKKTASKSASTTAAKRTGSSRNSSSGGFTAEEKAAAKERIKETRSKGDPKEELLAKIAEMPESDREMAERIHDIVTTTAPDLTCRTWYGMPAYAKDGKVICFFQSAAKFKSRYATFGFSDDAAVDDGAMWPTSYAVTKVGPAEEKKIVALLKKATR